MTVRGSRRSGFVRIILMRRIKRNNLKYVVLQSFNKSVNQSTNQSINQSINQPINQSINQSI